MNMMDHQEYWINVTPSESRSGSSLEGSSSAPQKVLSRLSFAPSSRITKQSWSPDFQQRNQRRPRYLSLASRFRPTGDGPWRIYPRTNGSPGIDSQARWHPPDATSDQIREAHRRAYDVLVDSKNAR